MNISNHYQFSGCCHRFRPCCRTLIRRHKQSGLKLESLVCIGSQTFSTKFIANFKLLKQIIYLKLAHFCFIMIRGSIAALILASTAYAQCTGSDLLVDDFSQSRRLLIDGAIRQANLLDADYGTDNPATTITVDTTARTLTVFAGTNESFFFAKYVSFFRAPEQLSKRY